MPRLGMKNFPARHFFRISMPVHFMNQAQSTDRRRFHAQNPVSEMERLHTGFQHLLFLCFREPAFGTYKPGSGFAAGNSFFCLSLHY